jgi:hypothetical protein
MRRIVIAAGLVALAMPASAQAASPHMCEQAKKVRASVIDKHGKRAPGRDICRFGVRRGGKVHAPSNVQKARYLRALKRLDNPPPQPTLVRTAVPPRVPPAGTKSPGVDGIYGRGGWAIPEYIVQCESGGDYGAVNPSSGATGAYQIMPGTAAAYGCSLATPAGQDQCAAKIYAREGAAPWSCG